jgi:hypothetical protein
VTPSYTSINNAAERTGEVAMRTHHHRALSRQLNDAGFDDWRRSVDQLAVANYYADKPLPLPPSAYVGPPATGIMGPFINFYRRNRRAVLFAATLLALGIVFVIIFTVLGRFGIGHGTQNGDDYGKGKEDTGYGGLPLSGKGDGTYYDPEGGVKGGIGSCGWVYTNNDMVAALVSFSFYTRHTKC